jgi:hypothetical protein
MKLLSTLIAATFAAVSYTAVAADVPAPAAKPAMSSMGAEALAPAAKDEAKPAKKAHKHNRHHKKHMKHKHMKSDATMDTPVK